MKSIYLSIIGTALTALPVVAGASEASRQLWYTRLAIRDFFDALPLGNGRLGAMLHGYMDKELIRLNGKSIWSGGPMDKIPPTAKDNLDTLRQQILNGSLTEAGETWSEHFVPSYDDMRRYQPAGEFRIDFSHSINSTSNYRRELGIPNGIALVFYHHLGVKYERKGFGNYTHNILAFKLSSDKSSSLSFNGSLTRDLNATHVSTDTQLGTLTLHGTREEDDTYRFALGVQVILSYGEWTVKDKKCVG